MNTSGTNLGRLPSRRQAMLLDRRKLAPPWREFPARRQSALRDLFAVEWIDDRKDYGEERIDLLGMCEGVILHVTYTERGE